MSSYQWPPAILSLLRSLQSGPRLLVSGVFAALDWLAGARGGVAFVLRFARLRFAVDALEVDEPV
ncbi:MAG: hypothetical protein LH624_00840 [Cryobacterium sp.]|nr:hypothetical protein [Cryobacterium sp.]